MWRWVEVSPENLKGGDWVWGAAPEKGRTQRGLDKPGKDKSGFGWNDNIYHVTSKIRWRSSDPPSEWNILYPLCPTKKRKRKKKDNSCSPKATVSVSGQDKCHTAYCEYLGGNDYFDEEKEGSWEKFHRGSDIL